MRKLRRKEKKERLESPMESELTNEPKSERRIKIDWGRQGGVIFSYVVVLFGYYGIIANLMMYDPTAPMLWQWTSFPDMNREMIFWSYITYLRCYFLPPLLLFFVCFVLTYKEDIPHYGIRASLWLVPVLIAEGFILYTLMFGVSAEPFILQFARGEGLLNIIILYGLAISGAILGMKLKQFTIRKREV